MTMIEKVARALWDARISKGGPGRTLMTFEAAPEKEWCINSARAAIEAMKEPNKAMLEVKTKSIDYTAYEIWNMFIEAALKE